MNEVVSNENIKKEITKVSSGTVFSVLTLDGLFDEILITQLIVFDKKVQRKRPYYRQWTCMAVGTLVNIHVFGNRIRYQCGSFEVIKSVVYQSGKLSFNNNFLKGKPQICVTYSNPHFLKMRGASESSSCTRGCESL